MRFTRTLFQNLKMTGIKTQGVTLVCDQCDYKAKRSDNLLTHIKSIHEGVKYPCDQCEYKATMKGHLLRHKKSKHEVVNDP